MTDLSFVVFYHGMYGHRLGGLVTEISFMLTLAFLYVSWFGCMSVVVPLALSFLLHGDIFVCIRRIYLKFQGQSVC